MTDPGFQEYPITMAHPAFKKSEPIPVPGSQIFDRQGRMLRQDYKGTPERYPPQTAANESEEEYWRAQGYERAGQMDPSAWVMAHAGPSVVDYVPEKYPMWKNGVLIKTAQEDPDAVAEDLAPKVVKPAPEPVVEVSEATNLRAQMDEMNRTMSAMMEAMKAQQEENLRLKAEATARADAPKAEAKRPPGRPRKAA